jgi:hypothetical protein
MPTRARSKRIASTAPRIASNAKLEGAEARPLPPFADLPLDPAAIRR